MVARRDGRGPMSPAARGYLANAPNHLREIDTDGRIRKSRRRYLASAVTMSGAHRL
jgi:hypothetical protein